MACALQAVLHDCPLILVDDYAVRPEYAVIENFVDVIATPGRMAVFEPKREINREECLGVCDRHYLDWR